MPIDKKHPLCGECPVFDVVPKERSSRTFHRAGKRMSTFGAKEENADIKWNLKW